MVIESFRLKKIYLKFSIHAIAKNFLREMSLSVSNKVPNWFCCFHD